jgi:hypothetical protein
VLTHGHDNNTKLPPVKEHRRFVRTDIQDTTPTDKPANAHLQECECRFECVFRDFEDKSLFLVCFEHGKYEHSCCRDNGYLLGVRPAETCMIYLGIVEFGTAEAFYEKILKERAEIGVRQSSFDNLPLRDRKVFAVKRIASPRKSPLKARRSR